MRAFWEVMWSDAVALALFIAPMVILALPASIIAAAIGAFSAGARTWRGLAWPIGRAILAGTLVSVLFSMAIEFALKAEGLPAGPRVMRDHVTWQLWIVALLVAIPIAVVVGRRTALSSVSRRAPRRYTLRYLFICQLIIGLLLGWWVFARRDEIVKRREDLAWQAQKGVFSSHGWRVQRINGGGIWLLYFPIPSSPLLRDEDLDLVAHHVEVEALDAISDAITDEGLVSLAKAAGIRDLSIQSKHITDQGVAALCEMPRLRYLTLHASLLTNAALEHLARVSTLRSISLSGNVQITLEQEEAFRRARPNVWLKVQRSANASADEID